MGRPHVVIEPSGDSIDFRRRVWDSSQIWLSYPKSAWLPTLTPTAIKETSASDFSFSTYRRFPSCNPADFALSNEPGVLTKIYCPLGGNWDPGIWVCLFYYSPQKPPIAGSERFYASSGGLARLLSEELEAPAFVDSLRRLDGRPKLDFFVRHDLRAVELAPHAIEMPRWMSETIGMSAADASARQAAMRQPTSSAEWYQIRARDRAAREAEHAKLAPVEPETPATPTEATPPPEPPPPAELSMDEKRKLAERKERMAKATKGAVAAQKFNEAAAKAHAAKTVARLERAGKL
jgi:hypothetical protein